MDDFFRKLFDQKDDHARRRAEEPSFDFHDFKLWLENQGVEDESLRDYVETNRKEKLREKFKERMRRKMRREGRGG